MSVQYYHEPHFSFSDVNRLFGDLSRALGAEPTRDRQNEGAVNSSAFTPKLDIHESPENNLVTATFELPGLKKEDVSIDLQNNRLVVSGETNFSKDTQENGYVVKERRRGKFSRAIPLPSGTKTDQIKASMENGVLSITFPKATPEETAKRITIS